MRCDILTGPEGLLKAEEPWRALERSTTAGYFQTYAVARSWFETIGAPAGAVPLIVVCTDGDTPVGIFPACAIKLHGVPVITWMGIPDILDVGDVLYDTGAATAAVERFVEASLQELRKVHRLRPLLLANVRQDALAAPAFGRLLASQARGAICTIDTVGDLERYERGLSSNQRKKHRRHTRQLEAWGDVSVQTTSVTGMECEQILRPAFEMKRAQRAAQGLPSLLVTDAYLRCHAIQHQLGTQGLLTTLLLDDTPVAYSYDIVHAGMAYGLLTTYEVAYAHASPGTVLSWRLLKILSDLGVSVWDWGWGLEPYKLSWNPTIVGLTTFVDRGVFGKALLGAIVTRNKLAALRDPHEAMRRRSVPDMDARGGAKRR